MSERLEITREQYEELRENPRPGFSVDMECKYWLELCPTDPAVPADEEWVSGHYKSRGIRRSRMAVIRLKNEGLLPLEVEGGTGRVANVILDELKGGKWKHGRHLAAAICKRLPMVASNTPDASNHVTSLIEMGALEFKNPSE